MGDLEIQASALRMIDKRKDKLGPFGFPGRAWDADFESVILHKFQTSKDTSKKLARIFAAKAALDDRYAKELKRLLSPEETSIDEESSLKGAWKGVTEALTLVAESHAAMGRLVFEEVHLPLQNVKDYVKEQRDHVRQPLARSLSVHRPAKRTLKLSDS
jgi:hypothetical protein